MQVEVSNLTAPDQLMIKAPRTLQGQLEMGKRLSIGLSQFKVRNRIGASSWKLQSKEGKIRIPGRWQLRWSRDEEQFRLGPVIGILSSRFLGRPGRPVSGPVGRFRRIVADARAMGALVFVFAPSGIQWRERTIRGYTYLRAAGGGRWVKGIFPFPNVVYNRIPTRRAEFRPTIAAARKRLSAESGLHLFNPQFLNKWEVYKALQRSADAVPFFSDIRFDLS